MIKMKLCNFIQVLLATWYLKTTSLPKLFYQLQDRRGVGLTRFRSLEKSGIKVTKLVLDVRYFENCIELGICPQFLKFKPPKLSAYKNTKNVYRQVLNNQIVEVKKKLKKSKDQYIRELKGIGQSISYVEKMVLCHLLRKRYEKFSVPVLEVHNKKLLSLWKSERSRSPNCFLNLSNVKFSILEENALRLGLKNHILPRKIDENALKVEVEKLVSNVTKEFNVEMNSEFKNKLRSMCKSFLSQANGLCSNKQNQLLHKTIRSLNRNKNIKICRYDKGNGVVILNSADYYNKLDTIILDKDKFEEITVDVTKQHPVVSNEVSIKGYLARNVKKCVEDSVYRKIVPSGSQPGKLYGLCKVHKANHPMRPVISMVGTAEYALAKYLDDFIKPNINVSHTVNSTNAFIEKLQEFQFSSSDHSVSFDVSSLYTNVPLDETIDLIAKKVYSVCSKNTPPFPIKVFTKLLKFATSGMFLYKESIYKQVDGVAMGSPLGPSLANFFLGHLEEYKFFNVQNINPKLYVRYVDDIYAIFDKDVHFQSFFNHINNQHPNIKFTVEESENNVLAFLDTQISIKDDEFQSCVFRKKTNTDVLLNNDAICPVSWKRGLIFGALNRAKMICSTQELFSKEVFKLRDIFSRNGYSNIFFNKVLDSFNQKFSVSGSQCVSEKRVINFNLILKVPFVGPPSHEFKNKISNLFFNDLRIEIFPIFTSTKLSDYFSLKSQTPKILASNVVYKYTCVCDTSLTYIGKTKRHLGVRSEEHLGYEKDLPKSEIKTHLNGCPICRESTMNNFEII